RALDREGQLSYDVLGYFLSIQIEGDRFRDYDFPVNQMFGVQATLPNFMSQVHQVTNEREAKRYIERLDKFPQQSARWSKGSSCASPRESFRRSLPSRRCSNRWTTSRPNAQRRILSTPASRKN